MTLTLRIAVEWISIGSVVATPATLCMIRLNEIGDNPFRNLAVWAKVALGWWLGLALTMILMVLGFIAFGPFMMVALASLMTGGMFELFFREGFWRSVWWAFGSLAILGIVIPLLVVGYSMLGPRCLELF